jgi:hypothetical protein
MLQRKTARAAMGPGKFKKIAVPDDHTRFRASALCGARQYLKHAKAKRISAGQNSSANQLIE